MLLQIDSPDLPAAKRARAVELLASVLNVQAEMRAREVDQRRGYLTHALVRPHRSHKRQLQADLERAEALLALLQEVREHAPEHAAGRLQSLLRLLGGPVRALEFGPQRFAARVADREQPQGDVRILLLPEPVRPLRVQVQPVRDGVHNFLQNLRAPIIFANDVLQGSPGRAGTTLARAIINSTLGVLGFGDPAAALGFEQHDEDFGQTLAVWGVGEGPYVMLPLFGPSNPRDVVGKVVDFFLDPINWWASNTEQDWIPITRAVVTGIDARDQLWDVLDDLERTSIDFYAAIRSLYRQRRGDEIRNGADGGALPTLTGELDRKEIETAVTVTSKE